MLALYAWIVVGIVTEGAGLPRRRRRRLVLWTVLPAAAITYAFGRGIHDAANSIHDGMGRGVSQALLSLAYLWDEHLGHSLVDFARVLFVIGITTLELPEVRTSRAGGGAGRIFIALGAAAYGFIYFATAVEGQTVPLALAFTTAYAIWGVVRNRRGPALVRGFFTAASLVSLLLFLVWGVWHRGFPEFSRSGLL